MQRRKTFVFEKWSSEFWAVGIDWKQTDVATCLYGKRGGDNMRKNNTTSISQYHVHITNVLIQYYLYSLKNIQKVQMISGILSCFHMLTYVIMNSSK